MEEYRAFSAALHERPTADFLAALSGRRFGQSCARTYALVASTSPRSFRPASSAGRYVSLLPAPSRSRRYCIRITSLRRVRSAGKQSLPANDRVRCDLLRYLAIPGQPTLTRFGIRKAYATEQDLPPQSSVRRRCGFGYAARLRVRPGQKCGAHGSRNLRRCRVCGAYSRDCGCA